MATDRKYTFSDSHISKSNEECISSHFLISLAIQNYAFYNI